METKKVIFLSKIRFSRWICDAFTDWLKENRKQGEYAIETRPDGVYFTLFSGIEEAEAEYNRICDEQYDYYLYSGYWF